MKFMMLLKADATSEAGIPPDEKLIVAMGKYNEELVKAGVLLAAEPLFPVQTATTVRVRNGQMTVTDGPFAETKELIAGYAIIQVKSRDEAIEWTKRFLTAAGEGESEIRQLHDTPAGP